MESTVARHKLLRHRLEHGCNCMTEEEMTILVEELDHFCPWTGTVIAKRNLGAFQMFLCLLLALLVYAAHYSAVAVLVSFVLPAFGVHTQRLEPSISCLPRS